MLVINIISVVVVLLDYKRIIGRVPSIAFHGLELLGGVVVMLPILYILRYRVTKESYFLVSLWTLTIWFFISYIKIGIFG
ncbi:hypothetical protein [Flammeovirga kamogawensis]|uniref:Uncharacterized protein n=1 Tax=Flammeovirga kamogawensis TaxID=373891 RepID=A0ABX8GTX9_9BACT|nr:hypothetical protein [Flammeovirga kamogawensis]MBB6463980.1 hypothetical protein [Flammeovirga kamogawensis]QWG06607.1 hypothetical protein KM029_14950 [Flammeovirga kamogawensis]TRX68431.1 hypothetical protein EO216_09945 [Flammeovirga kamogawensis]